MKDRIYKVMSDAGMNQKEFSQETGIAQATLSSIFSGRTSPTLKHADALHHRFPELSMTWLMFGEGDMHAESVPGTSSDGTQDSPGRPSVAPMGQEEDLFSGIYDNGTASSVPSVAPVKASTDVPARAYINNEAAQSVIQTVKYIDKPQRKITEIRIFFDDGTYQTFPGARL